MKKNESKSTSSSITNNWGNINNNDSSNNNFGSEVKYYQSSTSQNKNESQLINENLSIGKLIGEGGFGKVYQGKLQGKLVAIKKIPITKIGSTNKEVKFLKKLIKNDNVIEYYDEFQKNDNFYIVMEYAEKGSLKKIIDNNESNSHNWPLNYNFINQATKGLKHLHENEILHRDLKSDNILITKDNTLKLTDFGLVKFLDSSNLSNSGNKLTGTPRWLAPEVLGGTKHSYYSDIYSLGLVMWEIVAKNTKPFQHYESDINVIFNLGRKRKNENDEYKDIEKETIPTDTPQDLAEIINKCWEKIPNQRISLAEIENKLNNSKNFAESVEIKTLSNSTQSSHSSSQSKINQLQLQIKDKDQDLNSTINSLKAKLRSKNKFPNKRQEREEKLTKLFDDLPNNPQTFINYLEAIKNDLSKRLTQEEINNLYQIKQELAELSNQYSLQAQILQQA
jgi:serine/threonine protein kinase